MEIAAKELLIDYSGHLSDKRLEKRSNLIISQMREMGSSTFKRGGGVNVLD